MSSNAQLKISIFLQYRFYLNINFLEYICIIVILKMPCGAANANYYSDGFSTSTRSHSSQHWL